MVKLFRRHTCSLFSVCLKLIFRLHKLYVVRINKILIVIIPDKIQYIFSAASIRSYPNGMDGMRRPSVRLSARSWKICRSDCCENWHIGTFWGLDLHLGYIIFQKLIFSHIFGGKV